MKIRRNPTKKNGRSGNYKFRLSVRPLDPMKKMKTIEVGLGTDDHKEATERGRIVLRAFEAAGYRTNTRAEDMSIVECNDNLAHHHNVANRRNKGKIK